MHLSGTPQGDTLIAGLRAEIERLQKMKAGLEAENDKMFQLAKNRTDECERLQKQNRWLAERLGEEALKAGERAVDIASLRKTLNEQLARENEMTTRQDAYSAIDSERDYQDGKWGASASSGRPRAGERTIDEFALYITEYAAQLRHLAGTASDPQAKLHAVRKVAGLCVACMEQHGAPKR